MKVGVPRQESKEETSGKEMRGELVKKSYLMLDFSPTQFLGMGINWKQADVVEVRVAGKIVKVNHTIGGYAKMMRRLIEIYFAVRVPKETCFMPKVDITRYAELKTEDKARTFVGLLLGMGAARVWGMNDNLDMSHSYFLDSLRLEFLEPVRGASVDYVVKFRSFALKSTREQLGTISLYNKGREMEAISGKSSIADGLKTKIRIGCELYLNRCIKHGVFLPKRGESISIADALQADMATWETIRVEYVRIAGLLRIEGAKETLLNSLERLVTKAYKMKGPYYFQALMHGWLLAVSNFKMLFYPTLSREEIATLLKEFTEVFEGASKRRAKEIVSDWLSGNDISMRTSETYTREILNSWAASFGFNPRDFSFRAYDDLRLAQHAALDSPDDYRAYLRNKEQYVANYLKGKHRTREERAAQLGFCRKSLGMVPAVLRITDSHTTTSSSRKTLTIN
jgi:hypothetical protein